MSGPSDLILSVLMLAAAALVWGGVVQIRAKQRRGWLMLVAAIVLLGNILIWSV